MVDARLPPDRSNAELPNGEDRRTRAAGADLIIPALGLALTIYYLVDTSGLAWEARAAGVVVGCVLIGLIAVFAYRFARTISAGEATLSAGELFQPNVDNTKRLTLLVLLAAFIALIETLGTTLSVFLLLVATLLVMGVRRPVPVLAVAGVTSMTVYLLLIALLGTRLPTGPVEQVLARLFS